MRALLLVAVFLVPTLAGCFSGDEGPRLAQPTDKPPVIPSSGPPPPTASTFNLSDPGYRVTASWRAGDGWDYLSNQSHFRRVRILDSRVMNGATFYMMEEKTGKTDGPSEQRVVSWVDSRGWLILNATDDTGGVDTYKPGISLRFYKNGSFTYDHTRVEGSGRKSADENVTVASRLYGPHTTLQYSWGYVEAKRVEQKTIVRSGETRVESITMHYVHKDYLNDVQYTLPSGETFKLTAVKAGDFRRGTLST